MYWFSYKLLYFNHNYGFFVLFKMFLTPLNGFPVWIVYLTLFLSTLSTIKKVKEREWERHMPTASDQYLFIARHKHLWRVSMRRNIWETLNFLKLACCYTPTNVNSVENHIFINFYNFFLWLVILLNSFTITFLHYW